MSKAHRSAESPDPEESAYLSGLDRLQARGRFGMRLGLARTRALLRRLGNPERTLRGVLIGGTNGKGSTQALVGAALREAGYRVGQTPKPHLVSYRERIQVDGRPISTSDFNALLTEVMDADEGLVRRHGPSTEFEVLTCAAFLHFARQRVDVGVIEVGIGGRLDATNAWQGGVSAITNVALDHMEVLGNTIEAIAAEKAMIIKRGDHAAVTGAQPPALSVIQRRAARVKVPLRLVEPWPYLGLNRAATTLRAPDGESLRVGLLGPHQAANVAVAWSILDALRDAQIAVVDEAHRRAGFEGARWPGRMELIDGRGQPDVLLDGAHNPHGIAAFAAALDQLLPSLGGARPTILMAVLANHWQMGMLEPLRNSVAAAQFVATTVPGAANSMDIEELAHEWGPAALAVELPDAAFVRAHELAVAEGGPLLVCGSLYLVGHVRAQLLGPKPAV